METTREMILSNSIPHVCRPGETCSHYNPPQGGEMIEIPSAIFIRATEIEKKRQPNYSFPPD